MATILVADDVSDNRYMLASLLRGNGYDVAVAANGAEALSVAEGAPPDLIVTDIMMPEMDGFELCRRWRRDQRLKRIPFVIYTATYTDPKDERLALSLGADRFVVKPQKPDVILAIVREVLDAAGRDPNVVRAGPDADDLALMHQHRDALRRKLEKKIHDLESEVARRQAIEVELRENEQNLKESTALLRLAGRMARLGGWSINLAGGRVSWSDDCAAIFGMAAGSSPTLDELTGVCAPEWRGRLMEAFTACSRDGTPYAEEVEVLTANGRRTWVRIIGEAVRDEVGTIARVHGAIQDITERKQAEAERQNLHSQLLQAQKIESIGRLAGGVAHDFNNLLSAVLGYTDLAIDALREGDPLRADLDEVRKAGERAAALTRQLLAFSRKQILEPEVISLNQVVSGINKMLRRLLGEHIQVETNLAEDVGYVLADPGQIEQVIMNLAINARDAMPQGGTLTIQTAAVELNKPDAERHPEVPPGPHAMLSVTDAGSGMDEGVKAHLFEPFFTTKEKGKGTGLGLSTVYGIVKQSGGTIDVHSEVGRGTTIRIYLPQVDAPAARVRRKPVSETARGSETVLLVEDAETVRKMAERILRSAGYQVLAAGGGGDALLLCEQHRHAIDLLLTDVVMPHISGPELAERLSALEPRMKVLYMSGYTDDQIVSNSVRESGTRFVRKPLVPAELTRKVREVLDA